MVNDIPMLKIMVFSAVIGFVFFCASYTILVWKKRHQSSAGASTARSRLRSWSFTGIVLGSIGLLTTLVAREAVRAEGMLGGDGLYAVRATPDMRVVQLAEEGQVEEGDVVARFSSAEALADIQKAELTRDQLRGEKDILPSRPLPLDPELVRQHNLAEAFYNHLYGDLTVKCATRETAGRDNMPPIIQQRDNLANINRDGKLAEGDIQQTKRKLEIARRQLEREQRLANQQNVSTNDLNDRQKEVGALEVDVVKYEAQLAATQERLRVCKQSLEMLEQKAAAQDARLEAEVREARAKLAAAEIAKADAVRKLAEDARKAQERRNWEIEDHDFKIKQAELQIAAKINKLEVKAPFKGEVIYRHPSPGAAFNNGPVLVMGPRDALRFNFRLADSQVDALGAAGSISIDLEETTNTVEQRFTGKFLKATPLSRDPGMSLVELECQAPPETVAALTDGKPIKARFSWRPPLLNLWPFPTSLILFGLGVFGLVIVNVAGWRPSWPKVKAPIAPDDEDALVSFAKPLTHKEGDTEEAVAADTIPLRPEAPDVPRERPVQPWEHPVGIRLRESIIREDISAELLDAVEMAIDHQKDAVIVPMREALGRVPTVPDHARRLLDRLNNFETNDELKLIEKRCLAQRLTFLLYTLNVEIRSQTGPGTAEMAEIAGG